MTRPLQRTCRNCNDCVNATCKHYTGLRMATGTINFFIIFCKVSALSLMPLEHEFQSSH